MDGRGSSPSGCSTFSSAEPTLLRWEAEALKDDLLATPGVATLPHDVHRLTRRRATAEERRRRATSDPPPRSTTHEESGRDARERESRGGRRERLVNSMGEASPSLNEMMKSAGTCSPTMTREPMVGDAARSRVRHREYTEGVEGNAVAAGR